MMITQLQRCSKITQNVKEHRKKPKGYLIKVLLMEDLQPECKLKRPHTITRNRQYKIKNTAIKAEVMITKQKKNR